jgi:hypothetical protein
LPGDDELVGCHFVATRLAIWKRRNAEDSETKRPLTLRFLRVLKNFAEVELGFSVFAGIIERTGTRIIDSE